MVSRKYKRINNKGNVYVEASIIFPLIIFAAIGIFCLCINMFVVNTKKINAHYNLFAYADKKTKTISADIKRKNFDKLSKLLYLEKPKVYDENQKVATLIKKKYFMPKIIKKKMVEESKHYVYVIDEESIIRNDFF